MSEQQDPQDQVRQLTEDAEKRTAAAMEQLVHSNAFGELAHRQVLHLALMADELPERRIVVRVGHKTSLSTILANLS